MFDRISNAALFSPVKMKLAKDRVKFSLAFGEYLLGSLYCIALPSISNLLRWPPFHAIIFHFRFDGNAMGVHQTQLLMSVTVWEKHKESRIHVFQAKIH